MNNVSFNFFAGKDGKDGQNGMYSVTSKKVSNVNAICATFTAVCNLSLKEQIKFSTTTIFIFVIFQESFCLE